MDAVPAGPGNFRTLLKIRMADPVKRVFACLRTIVRTVPGLRMLILPVYGRVEGILWPLRNLVLRNRPVEIRGRHGPIYMVPEGQIAEVVWRSGFEEHERSLVEQCLKPGMHVLNVGANAGLYTLLAARIVGPSGDVHAFEPASVNVDRLARNIVLNGLTNVFLNQCAVSDRAGTLEVCRDPMFPQFDGHYSVRALDEGRADLIERVQSTTLDEYWMRHCAGALRPADMLIIDVEGAELQVIRGALSLFSASPSLIMMVECTRNLNEIERILNKAGFSFYVWNASTAHFEQTRIVQGNLFIGRNLETRLLEG